MVLVGDNCAILPVLPRLVFLYWVRALASRGGSRYIAHMDALTNNTCPGCGASFRCGAEAGDETCWCASYPILETPLPGAACYCPECLRAALAKAGETPV